jgi:5-methylcytosine-specific restriction endonuclease McrA
MKIDDGQYVGSMNELKIFELLCNGKTQAETAKILGFSRPYINQVTKVLLTLGVIKEKKREIGVSRTYDFNKEIPEVSLELHLPKRKKKLGRDKCLNCGKRIKVNRKFCNQKCRGLYQSGPRSPQWKGGSTFSPYCWKFNESLKLRVRSFFNHTCFACGDLENGTTLHVHHINYNKMACCNGDKEALLIPLCESCHNRTNHDSKHGFWEKLFYTQLMERTGGKCYYSKKEWRKMNGDPAPHHLLSVNENLLR